MAKSHEQWLLELTRTPTAAGCEGRVVAWVERWAGARRFATLRRDRFGNLELRRRGATVGRPIYFEAHMDHPAFVVQRVAGRREIIAEFRGGVQRAYFDGAAVLLHRGDEKPRRGIVDAPQELSETAWMESKAVRVRFGADVNAEAGDLLTWDTGRQRVRNDRLHTPAADNLAGVCAALAAFDAIHGGKARRRPDVRVLLTRAEEVGFIGAIAAARAKLIPTSARIVVLEMSRSFPESPIGAGPILRVGDRTSIFDADLSYRIGQIAARLQEQDSRFTWQRKLMPGGTCEATAFCAFGYTAACVCLPLGNYHNMNEKTGRIAAEFISLADFHGLVRLLVAVGTQLDDKATTPTLRSRLLGFYTARKSLLK